MLSTGALDNWQHQAHGPRIQGKAISYITAKLLIYEAYADMIGNNMPSLTEVLEDCNRCCTPDVNVRTLWRWWRLYEEWGELPHKVAGRKRLLHARGMNARKGEVMDDGDVLILKGIVDSNPNLYLDELSFLFGITTNKFVHYSTIRQCLDEKLGYSMKMLQTVAKQQCEEDETRFLQALDIILQQCPERLITVDETH